jgi:hypothetical protein
MHSTLKTCGVTGSTSVAASGQRMSLMHSEYPLIALQALHVCGEPAVVPPGLLTNHYITTQCTRRNPLCRHEQPSRQALDHLFKAHMCLSSTCWLQVKTSHGTAVRHTCQTGGAEEAVRKGPQVTERRSGCSGADLHYVKLHTWSFGHTSIAAFQQWYGLYIYMQRDPQSLLRTAAGMPIHSHWMSVCKACMFPSARLVLPLPWLPFCGGLSL